MAQKTKAALEKDVALLQKENKGLKDALAAALKEIDRIKEVDIPKVDPNRPLEEQIIENEIKKLMADSLTRNLTIDETRALDLLLKNKRIIEDKKPKKNEDEVPEGTTDADLLRIVSNGEERPQTKKVKKRTKQKTSD